MKHQFSYTYEIGETVYHKLEENRKGMILDVYYSKKHQITTYKVVFGSAVADDVICEEMELSTNPYNNLN